jgi:hypothetical protein
MIAAAPYFLAAATVLAGVAYLKGRADGQELQSARCLRDEQISAKAAESAASAAAHAISRIKVENRTVQQRFEREIQTRVEYRDCVHAPGVRDVVNEALTGRRPDPAADRRMPAADAVGR